MIPILSAEKITKDYGKEKVIKGITLALDQETFTVILGPPCTLVLDQAAQENPRF